MARAEDPGAWRLAAIAPSGNRYEICGCGKSLRLDLEGILRYEGWRVSNANDPPPDLFAPLS